MNREWLEEIHQNMLGEPPPENVSGEELVQRILEGWNPAKIDQQNAHIFKRGVIISDFSEVTREWAMDLEIPTLP